MVRLCGREEEEKEGECMRWDAYLRDRWRERKGKEREMKRCEDKISVGLATFE